MLTEKPLGTVINTANLETKLFVFQKRSQLGGCRQVGTQIRALRFKWQQCGDHIFCCGASQAKATFKTVWGLQAIHQRRTSEFRVICKVDAQNTVWIQTVL